MRFRPSLLVSLLVLAASCGSSTTDPGDSVTAGTVALSSGDARTALESFDAALAAIQPTDDLYREAKLGQIGAQCHFDAAKAKGELLASADALKLEARDYRSIVNELVAAATKLAKGSDAADKDAAKQTITVAVEVLEAGAKACPDYDKWDALTKVVGDRATSLGADDAMSALSGLGYVGGD